MRTITKLYRRAQTYPISTLDLSHGIFQVNRFYAIPHSRRLIKWEKRACQLLPIPSLSLHSDFSWDKKASSPVPLMRSSQMVIYFTKQLF